MTINTRYENDMNFLQNNHYHIEFKEMPVTSLFVTEVDFPGLTLGYTFHPTGNIDYPIPGDNIEFDPLTITINVDEYLKSYFEILRWIYALGFPKSTDQFKKLVEGNTQFPAAEYADMTLTVLSSKSNPILYINFVDAFPITLSSFQLTEKQAEPQPVVATATFVYSYYEFRYV